MCAVLPGFCPFLAHSDVNYPHSEILTASESWLHQASNASFWKRKKKNQCFIQNLSLNLAFDSEWEFCVAGQELSQGRMVGRFLGVACECLLSLGNNQVKGHQIV